MKLTELNPRWVGNGGDGVRNADGSEVPRREGVAVSFDCPCHRGSCARVTVMLKQPLDGGPPISGHAWDRTGETFETLTLTPSIQRVAPATHPEDGGCYWHGFVTNGEVTNAG